MGATSTTQNAQSVRISKLNRQVVYMRSGKQLVRYTEGLQTKTSDFTLGEPESFRGFLSTKLQKYVIFFEMNPVAVQRIILRGKKEDKTN